MTDERKEWQNNMVNGLRTLNDCAKSISELEAPHPDIHSDNAREFLRDLIEVLDGKVGDPPLDAQERLDLFKLSGLLQWTTSVARYKAGL